jgi:WD40 repeat protein
MKFLIYEQQYLEILESKNLLHALQCLRENISPLQVHQSRVKLLSRCALFNFFLVFFSVYLLQSLLMCQSLAEIREKATWEGATGGSRAALLKKLQGIFFENFIIIIYFFFLIVFFPPAHMIQDDRLDTLIRQAVDHQEEQCLFHNYEDAYVTLYEDHVCPRKEFPLQCVCVLKQHSDEVWFVKFSNDGSRLASASKDKTVILWDVAVLNHSPSPIYFEALNDLKDHASKPRFKKALGLSLVCGVEPRRRVHSYLQQRQEYSHVGHFRVFFILLNALSFLPPRASIYRMPRAY